MAALPGRTGDGRFTGEQAALRRVATLVARSAAPEDVFAAVTEEAGRVLGADHTSMARYDPDGARTVVAAWSSIRRFDEFASGAATREYRLAVTPLIGSLYDERLYHRID